MLKESLLKFFNKCYDILLDPNASPKNKALSISWGVFIGLTPLWGLHTIIIILLATWLKLHKGLALLSSQISAIPFIPFIIYSCMYTGSFFIESDFNYNNLTIENTKNYLTQYLIGSFVLGSILAPIIGGISYLFFSNRKQS